MIKTFVEPHKKLHWAVPLIFGNCKCIVVDFGSRILGLMVPFGEMKKWSTFLKRILFFYR
jgi:hypothetical protein